MLKILKILIIGPIFVGSVHSLAIEIINNKVRHNMIDAKGRWRSDRLDGAESFWEPLCHTKVIQIHLRETQIYKGAITNEICCSSAELCFHFQEF